MSDCNTAPTSGCSSNELAVQIMISNNKITAKLGDLEVVLNDLQVALAALCEEEGNNLQLISGKITEIINANAECCALLLGKLTTLKTVVENIEICGETTATTTIGICGLEGEIICNGTDVTITIVAGADISNTLELYYWDNMTLHWVYFDSVAKATLETGYSFASNGHTRFRIDDLGSCNEILELEVESECTTSTTGTSTTSTTEEPVTTTSELPVTTTTCAPLTVIQLRIGTSLMTVCSESPEIYYMDTALIGAGSYIFTDICGETPISANFVVDHVSGTIYNCSGNLVGSDTGLNC